MITVLLCAVRRCDPCSMPSRWAGKSIVVLESVVVLEPYTTAEVRFVKGTFCAVQTTAWRLRRSTGGVEPVAVRTLPFHRSALIHAPRLSSVPHTIDRCLMQVWTKRRIARRKSACSSWCSEPESKSRPAGNGAAVVRRAAGLQRRLSLARQAREK